MSARLPRRETELHQRHQRYQSRQCPSSQQRPRQAKSKGGQGAKEIRELAGKSGKCRQSLLRRCASVRRRLQRRVAARYQRVVASQRRPCPKFPTLVCPGTCTLRSRSPQPSALSVIRRQTHRPPAVTSYDCVRLGLDIAHAGDLQDTCRTVAGQTGQMQDMQEVAG